MTTVMLDTNCLIDLKQGRQPHAEQLHQVLTARRRQEFELVVGAIAASENARPGEEPSFQEVRGAACACRRRRRSPPAADDELGSHLLGRSPMADDESRALEAKVHAILAPRLRLDDASDPYRWRDVKCDVQLVWTASWYWVDMLVTREAGIVRKADALADLGAPPPSATGAKQIEPVPSRPTSADPPGSRARTGPVEIT